MSGVQAKIARPKLIQMSARQFSFGSVFQAKYAGNLGQKLSPSELSKEIGENQQKVDLSVLRSQSMGSKESFKSVDEVKYQEYLDGINNKLYKKFLQQLEQTPLPLRVREDIAQNSREENLAKYRCYYDNSRRLQFEEFTRRNPQNFSIYDIENRKDQDSVLHSEFEENLRSILAAKDLYQTRVNITKMRAQHLVGNPGLRNAQKMLNYVESDHFEADLRRGESDTVEGVEELRSHLITELKGLVTEELKTEGDRLVDSIKKNKKLAPETKEKLIEELKLKNPEKFQPEEVIEHESYLQLEEFDKETPLFTAGPLESEFRPDDFMLRGVLRNPENPLNWPYRKGDDRNSRITRWANRVVGQISGDESQTLRSLDEEESQGQELEIVDETSTSMPSAFNRAQVWEHDFDPEDAVKTEAVSNELQELSSRTDRFDVHSAKDHWDPGAVGPNLPTDWERRWEMMDEWTNFRFAAHIFHVKKQMLKLAKMCEDYRGPIGDEELFDRTFSSVLPYYYSLPKFLRENVAIQDVVRGLEYYHPKLGQQEKENLVNLAASELLPPNENVGRIVEEWGESFPYKAIDEEVITGKVSGEIREFPEPTKELVGMTPDELVLLDQTPRRRGQVQKRLLAELEDYMSMKFYEDNTAPHHEFKFGEEIYWVHRRERPSDRREELPVFPMEYYDNEGGFW
eukprot:CAMPEP_0115029288 /NCGR_PEP_ID=MMETSP0216-20121206/36889_1 /TAXON_ID=223996 /ORGANISM="Protocruzia adherens, Strain Boccale" /LENGTH=684 /DNA_ID=CAMNT_0002405799 /DNA_START=27 /DNA_END=2078 /DNA_ORIENTATION=-